MPQPADSSPAERSPIGRARSLSEIGQPPPTEADRLTADEIRAVLDHYDLGRVRSAQQMAGGTTDAPKALITTGPLDTPSRFVLKRRAPGNDDPFAVALAHSAMLHLADAGVPVPTLAATRRDHNSMVQLGRHLYELLGFIEGQPFNGTPEQARTAGGTLRRVHRELATFHPSVAPQRGSYHASELIIARLERIATMDDDFAKEAKRIEHARAECARRVDDLGFDGLPRGLTHGDWHPGNLLFQSGMRDGAIVGVLDFDAPRLAPRVTDIANGSLQFSLAGKRDGAGTWRLGIDTARRDAFLTGYAADGESLEPSERAMLKPLMAEALIAELSGPIAQTGRFGDAPGPAFLASVADVIDTLLSEGSA